MDTPDQVGNVNADGEVLAIIPAKGTSERLPRKNMRLLAGRPLIDYTIEAAQTSGIFSEICVTTEDQEIADFAVKQGASVPFLRPEELSTSSARLVQVCKNTIEFYTSQGRHFLVFCLLLPTCPLRTAQDISDCYKHFKHTGADALMTYSEFDHSPYYALIEDSGFLKPIFVEETRIGRDKRPTPYRHNGAVLLIRTEEFMRVGEYYVDEIVGWYLPSPNGLDVDTEHDLRYAEGLLAERQQGHYVHTAS